MSYLGRLPIDILRKRYAKMHQMLQAAIGIRIKLEERVTVAEAEAAALRIERDRLLEERDGGRRDAL